MKHLKITISALAALGFVVLTQLLAQALDPAPKCESGKLKEAGKYASCHLKADSKAVKKGTTADYSKCDTKFSGKWDKLESKGAGACPSNGDKASMQARVTLDEAEVAILLAGGTVPECGNSAVEGNESCDGSDLAGQDCVSLGYASGTLGCTAGCGYDVSGCLVSPCGNGVVDPGEDCDFQDLNGQDCVSQGFASGRLECAAGCSFDTSNCSSQIVKIVFVTSTITNGAFGGLAGADNICQSAAVDAGLPGTYLAWLSDMTTDPSTRFSHSIYPYVRTDGSAIAVDWLDLIDGAIINPMNIDEYGSTVSNHFAVWTATWAAGTLRIDPFDYIPATTCLDWTSSAAGAGAYTGDVNATGTDWTEVFFVSVFCEGGARLYCFEQ